MMSRARLGRDPFEGSGAYRTRIRVKVEGAIALAMAIVACGLTAMMWFRVLTPAFERLLGG
ncbi:MAG TPA: hypothetical protein VH813_10560 [Candidatus Limnocylindrales bacterium]|jgi:hypothetical protein